MRPVLRFSSCLVFASLSFAPGVRAQSVWDGGGTNDNWSTQTNWVGDVAPALVTTNFVTMAGVVRLTPNVNSNWTFQGLIFSNGAFTLSGSNLTITANANAPGGPNVFEQRSPSNAVINNSIILPATTTNPRRQFYILGSGAATFNGGITNTGTGETTVFIRGDGPGQGRLNGRVTIGTNKVSKTENSIWTIANTANQWGPTDLGGTSTVRLAVNDALPTNTFITFSNGARLDLSNFNQTVVGLTGTGVVRTGLGTGGRFTVADNGATNTFFGTIEEKGALHKRGTGTLNLSGANTFTGGVNVGEGVLRVTAGGKLANSAANPIVISNAATLVLSNVNAFVTDHSAALTNLITVQAGGTLKGDKESRLGNIVLNGGTILLDGGSATYGTFYLPETVTVAGSSASLITNTAATNSYLPLGPASVFNVGDSAAGPASDLDVYAPLANRPNNAGAANLTKSGAGTMTLHGNHSISGTVSLTGGRLTLAADGSLSNATINVGGGAVLDVQAIASYAVPAGQTILGSGSVTGVDLSVSAPARVVPGNFGTAGSLTLNLNSFTMGAAYTNEFDLTNNTTVAGGNDLLVINNTNGFGPGSSSIRINPIGRLTTGTYRLINYTAGTKSGSFTTPVLGNTTRDMWTLEEGIAGQINLTVSGATNEALVWSAGTTADWDLGTTNWTLVTLLGPDRFYDNDVVLFDDSGATSNLVNIATQVKPFATTVSSSSNYTFQGTGRISGVGGAPASFTKDGSGTLTILTTNDYPGATIVSNGAIVVGNGGAVGSLGTGPLFVEAPASITYHRNDNFNLAVAMNGAGTMVFRSTGVSGQGSFSFTGVSTGFVGTVVATNARLAVDSANDFGSATQAVAQAGGQIYLTNLGLTNPVSIAGTGWPEAAGILGAVRLQGGSLLGPVALAANARIGAYGNDGSVAGPISGAYELEFWNGEAGRTIRIGADAPQAYASTRISSNITVFVTNVNALSTGPLIMNRGTLRVNGNNLVFTNLSSTESGGTLMNGSTTAATVTVGSDGSSQTFGGVFVNGVFAPGGIVHINASNAPLHLTKVGAGSLTLANNTSSGTNLVAEGSVVVSNGTWSGPFTVAPGASAVLQGGDGLVGEYYHVLITQANFNVLSTWNADLARYAPLMVFKSGAAGTNFDFGSGGAAFPPGIAAANNSNIQARWTGRFVAPTNGLYTFITLSDDGAAVWVDGTNVVLNNRFGGYAGSDKTGTVTLAEGLHDITIGFFQGGSGIGFTVDYIPPGGTRGRLWNASLLGGAGVGPLNGIAGSTLYLSNGVTVVNQSQASDFGGTISGDGGIRKVGPATMTLSGTGSYTDSTTVAGGGLVVNGTLSASPVTVAIGSLGGVGTIGGAVSVQNGALVMPALAGTVGQLNFGGALAYAAGATTVVDFAAGTNDTFAVAGALDGNGSVVAVNPSVALVDGTYPLAPYGSLANPFRASVLNLNPGVGGLKSLYVDHSVAGLVQLTVAARPPFVAWNSTSSTVWDVAGLLNWSNSVTSLNEVFYNGDGVLFDDRPGVTQIVTIAAGVTVQPTVVTFDNAVNIYTVQLAGAMSGTGSIMKTGSGTATIVDTTGSTVNRNFMTGDTIVNGGRLILNGPNDGTPVLGLGQVIVRPGGILQSDSSNVYGLQQTGFVQRLVLDGGTLRPFSSTHFNQIVLRSNAVVEAHTSAGGSGLDAYAISNVLAQISVESSSATITNAAKITIGNSTNNTIFSTEDGPAAIDAEYSGQLVLGGDTRHALFTNAGTTVLSGNGDNAFFRAIVTTGRLILAKTSSGSIHAIGGNVSNLFINGGTVRLAGTGGDQIVTGADVYINDGVLDLNGLSEGYDALGGTGGTILNGVAGTISSNIVGQGGNGTTYGGTIQDGAGLVAFSKSGSGTEVLTGTNTFTGTAWVQEGTLVLSNAGANAIATTEIFLNDGSGNAVLQLGLPNQIPDNAVLTYRSGTTSGNSGKLQMMGQSETVGDILIASGSQSVLQNSEAEVINVDGTLTIAGGGNSVMPEVVRDRQGGAGTGRLAIVKSGSGTLLVAGGVTPTYTGPTTINGGSFFVNGTLATAAAPVTVNGGLLAGTGVVNRAVVVAAGGTVQPGYLTNGAALTITSLNANVGANLSLLVGGTGAILRVAGNNGFTVPASGQATVVVQTAVAVGTYGLIDYAGTIQGGSVAANLGLAAPPRATATLFDNTGNTTVELLVSDAGEAIKWTGATNNLWDVNASVAWKTQVGLSDTTYLQPGAVGDAVLFDDSAAGNFSVDLAATVSPADAIVSNELNDYVLSGQGIAGTVGLTKNGAAALTLSNMNLACSGVTRVNGGTLKLDTLTGFAGSLVNNSTTELAAASGNWDLGTARTISGGGLLRKTGSGTVSLNNSIVASTGAIEVVAGTLRNSGNGTVWTSASPDLDVASGAIFDVRGDAVRVDVLSGSGAITNSYGNNQIETLTIGAAGGSGTFAGTIRDSGAQFLGENLGSLGVTKIGTGTQTFAGVNSYLGPTTVDQGTLVYTADNSLRELVFGLALGGTNVPSLDLTAASLTATTWSNVCNNANETNLVAIGAGRALTINGQVTIGAPQTNRVNHVKLFGGGSFVVVNSNGAFRVSNAPGTVNGSSIGRLDMNGLGTASIDLGTNGTLSIGSGDNSAGFAPSHLLLAATTTVTAASLNIGPSANGSQHALMFGAVSNRLNVDTLNFGTGARDRANVGFTNATGSLIVRDRAGNGRAALNLSLTFLNTGTGYAGEGLVDLRSHYSDLLLSTLNIGVGARNGWTTNTFSFDTGTMDLQQLRMALFKGSGSNVAILNIGGGTVNIGTNGVMLASNGVSYVNLTGGTITSGSRFERGTNGTGAAILTLAGATLDMTGNAIGSPVPLTVVNLESGTLANVGELNNGAAWAKTSTGTLTIAGSNGISGPGFVSNGTLIVNGTLGAGGITTVAGTTLGGSGVIGGTVTAEGLVSPGTSAGILTIGGDYALTASTATQLVEIGGTTPGSGHDQLVVSNFAAVTASLEVQLIGGHTPVAGNAYTILVASTVSGPFSTVSLPALATNLGWEVQYPPGAVVLAVTGGVTLSGYDLAATTILNGLSGYNDDADGDGYANLLEYVTGGSLTNPGTQARMNGSRTNNMLALKFSRDTAATDATIYVEGSFTATNGANWIGVATNIGGSWGGSTNVTESGPSPVSVTVQDTIAPATNRFLRLRVTRP